MPQKARKRQILGHPAANVQPAWRASISTATQEQKVLDDRGSKILLSRLPVDVGESEVQVRKITRASNAEKILNVRLGTFQEDGGTVEKRVFSLRFSRQANWYGSRFISAPR